MHKDLLRLGVISLLTLVLAVPPSQGADKRFEKKLPGKPGETLTLTTDIGSVSVTGAAVTEVSVVAEMKGKEKDIEKFVITAAKTENGVEIKGELTKKRTWFWSSVDLDVQFVVQVPREYNLALRTSGGNIDVAGIKGKVTCGTSGGNGSVVDVQGDVSMETSGGNLRAERGTGSLLMKTSGGNVSASGYVGDIDLATSGGNVRAVDVDGMVRARTSGGSVHVTLSGSNKGVHAETSGGDVEITVPNDLKANLDLSTSGGHVACDIPVTVKGKLEEDNIRGSVNGGGNLIWAHTSGGNVHVSIKE